MITVSLRMLPFAVLLVAALWGSAFPAIKAIYEEWAKSGIEPTVSRVWLLAGLRFILAGTVILILAPQPFKELRDTSKLKLMGFALGQTYFQYLLFYPALTISSAVLGGLLTGSGSIWWMLLAPLLLKTPWPSPKQWVFVAMAVLGVVLAIYKPGVGSGNPVLGGLLFCCCTLSGACALIILNRMMTTMKAITATGFGLLIGGVLLTLSGVGAWSDIHLLFSAKVIWLSCYLAMVSAVGFGLWNYLTGIFSVTLLAGYRFLIPVCAVIESSLLVRGESPGVGIWLGGTLVVVAIIFLQRLSQDRNKRAMGSA